jgi:hypothetical protein
MIIDKGVRLLAEEIGSRSGWDEDAAFERVQGEQFILFIGSGVARAAGTSVQDMAYHVFRDLIESGSSLAEDYLREENLALIQQDLMPDPDELELAFYDLLSGMSSTARYSLLQRFFAGIPVPQFYQDLAGLISDGYFGHVLTTTIDTLLEQALDSIGLQRRWDFQVINLGTYDGRPVFPSDPDEPIAIVKLHGDVTEGVVAVTPEEIENALRSQRRFVKGELSSDMVVVGYNFESEPVNDWLARTFGDLWWVEPQPHGSSEDAQQMSRIESMREVKFIDGPSAAPERFFGLLAATLSRYRPEMDWEFSVKSPVSFGDEPQKIERGMPRERRSLPTEDDLEVQYLQEQLRNSQAVLENLNKQAIRGEGSARLQTQVDYQQKQIAQIEGDLRRLSSTSPRVVELMEQIVESAERSGSDEDLVSFLSSQVGAVRDQHQRGEANQDIVEAAIGATVMVAKGLGADAVDEETVRQLATFAPSLKIGGRA